MAQYQHQWPVVVLCAVLEVRRNGFYPSVHRHAPTQREAAEAALVVRVKAIAAATRSSYGSRRMAKQLQEDGCAGGRYKARRLMQQAAVTVQRRKKRQPMTTDSRHGYGVAPNVLARQFKVRGQIACGLGMSYTCGRWRGGYTWRSCWTCIPARSWGGRCVTVWMRHWFRRRYRWHWGGGNLPRGCLAG